MRFTPQEIQDALSAEPVCPCRYDELIDLAWDSRKIQPGWIYVGIPGERVDGNDFACSAMKSGARMILLSRDATPEELALASELGVGVIVVENGVDAIAALAQAWRARLSATVIGVTGSVGKTTTKALIRDILGSKYKTNATVGNYNNEIGAPYTVLSTDEDCEMLVVEMGMDGLGQIAEICKTAKPDMGIITIVGTSHLEYLKTRENIARAKGELAQALHEGGILFQNAAGEYTSFIEEYAKVEERGVKTVHYGDKDAGADVFATDIETDGFGCPSFTLHADGESARCALPLRGVHNVTNACGAAAVALACGMTIQEVAAALSQVNCESGRQELLDTPGGAKVFNDAYNASPESMKASLAMLKSFKCEGKRIAILGDMGELGASSHDGHVSSGGAAAQADLSLLVCVGEQAGLIAQGAREGGMPEELVVEFSNSADACAFVVNRISAGDVVLVKASRFMGLESIVRGIIESC